MMRNDDFIYEKFLLAKYINIKYREKFNGKNITAIKMQKSLYFLFAYWGSFIKGEKDDETEIKSSEIKEEDKASIYIFNNAKFEAWKYGPVEKDIYNESNIYLSLKKEKYQEIVKEISKNIEAKNFIDEMLEEIFSMSDFILVNKTHNDLVWKKAFQKAKNKVNKKQQKIIFLPIDSNEIINEYLSR